MAGGIDWFRWHHGSVTDPKFQLVARKAKARLGDVVTVWAFVLEKASADPDRGSIGMIDFETLDFLLDAEEGTAARILDAMAARGLIAGNRIAAWEKRQPKRERDDGGATERKQRQRERESAESGHVTPDGDNPSHVTPVDDDGSQSPPCHAMSRQKKPRGEERRGEKGERARASPRGERLPHAELPQDWRTFCQSERPDLDPDSVFARFADYWRGIPGAKGRKSDWLATWRNWVRDERQRPRAPGGGPEPWAGAI